MRHLQVERLILTPCPPKKRCPICEARLSEVFGSADHTNRYLHQAREAALRVGLSSDEGIALVVRAASFANLVLEKGYQVVA